MIEGLITLSYKTDILPFVGPEVKLNPHIIRGIVCFYEIPFDKYKWIIKRVRFKII